MSLPDVTAHAEDFGRTPPHDLLAEQRTLGSMLMSPFVACEVAIIIKPEDHYRPAHQIVHETILGLDAEGQLADIVTVAHTLAKAGELARVGGHDYLHTLLASVPTPANGVFYARIVHEHAVRRRAIEQGTRIVQLGYEGDGDAAAIADRARVMADEIAADVALDDLPSMDDLFREVIEDLENDAPRGLPTPWEDVTEAIGGLMPGEVIVLAGRTGSGKSLAALGIAANVAIRGNIPVLLDTMEMNRNEVMTRLIAAEGEVPLHLLLHRRVTSADWDKIASVRERISSSPLVIDDSPACSLPDIRSRLRGMSRAGKAAGLLVVDYIGLLESSQAENRQQAVSALSRGLKLLAGEFRIPVVVVAQLNRMPEHRSDKRPQSSDLRESGSIENDASVVALLHRPDLTDSEHPRAGEIDFIIDKNRHGPRCTITEAFQGHYARITDMSPAWSASRHAVPDGEDQ